MSKNEKTLIFQHFLVFFYGGEYRNRTDESEFCRLVPYRLANSPFISVNKLNGAGSGNRTRESTLARLHFTTKLYLHAFL